MKKSMAFEGIATILLLALVFLLYVMVTTSNPEDNNWEVAGAGPVLDIHLGGDGTLYAFTGATGNTINAIDDKGIVRWTFRVPDQWRVANTPGRGIPYLDPYSNPEDEPVFATDNGTLYLYVRGSGNIPTPEERLLAISDNGSLLWAAPLGNHTEPYSDTRVSVENGSIYAYADYKVTVLNEAGKALFAVDRVSDPPAVDENGNMYLSPSKKDDTWNGLRRYQEPAGTIVCYNPTGSVEWVKDPGKTLARPAVADNLRPLYDSLPVYQNGLLYVSTYNGILVMYPNGTVKWSREFHTFAGLTLFPTMPFDENGDVYLSQNSGTGIHLIILDRNGVTLADEQANIGPQLVACGDPYTGRMYYYNGIEYHGNTTLENLITYDVAAYDLAGNRKLWSFAIPAERTSSTIVTKNNMDKLDLVGAGAGSYLIQQNSGREIGTAQALRILPAKDNVYLSFYTASYQSPVVPGRSRCTYSSAIYALSKDGTLLWSRPTDSFAQALALNNSTIYYGTKGGEVVSTRADNVVGGIALIAILYLFLRFVLVGAVARARDRLDGNENRLRILDFVRGNPGSTVHEIARGTGVNLGTARYHVFILGMNHKVVASQTDGKYVRYFTNSNSYNKDEQLVLSLMRRDAIGKILGLILRKPGISNVQIADELGMRESVVCRYVKELSEKGVVARDPGETRGAYSVPPAYSQQVADAVRRLQGQ